MSKMFDYIVNGGDDLALAKATIEHMSGYLGVEIEENMRLRAALHLVRGIIVEGAAVGFNPLDGDWADRLYESQADTFEALHGRRAAAPKQPGAT